MQTKQARRGRPNKYDQNAAFEILDASALHNLRVGSKAYELAQLIQAGAVSTPSDWSAIGGRSYVITELVSQGFVRVGDAGMPVNVIEDSSDKDAMQAVNEALSEPEEQEQPEPEEQETFDGEILPEWFDRAMRLAEAGYNILFTGPSGSGKTYIAAKIAEKLERPFGMQSCSEGMSESNLVGYLLPIGEVCKQEFEDLEKKTLKGIIKIALKAILHVLSMSGKMVYTASPFVDAYENGGVFLLDEFDASDANTSVFINAALAGDSFMVPQRYNKPLVKRHENFVCIAATNTLNGANSLYTGRNQLDAATLDRFRTGICKCEYSKAVEERLCNREILNWGREIRQVIERNKFEHVMSTRTLIDATEQLRQGFTVEEIRESYFADWSKDEVSLIHHPFR